MELIDDDRIPIFPTIVVKVNERIATRTSDGLKSTSSVLKSANTEKQFYFIDEIFNNSENQKTTKSRGSNVNPNPTEADLPTHIKKTVDAYKHFKNSNGWQRDYSYYDLTPTKTRGTLDKSIVESIVTFQLTGNGLAALAKIGDQKDDPHHKGKHPRYGGFAGWTDGEFEFKIKIYVGNIAGFGTETFKLIRVQPSELFEPIMEITGPRYAQFTGNFNVRETVVNQPLFTWDLETFAYAIKIAVEEVDNAESQKSSITTTAEFATNFEQSSTTGESDKVGLKWGGSSKRTISTTFESTVTKGNDELGETVVSFGDDVIINDNVRTVYVYKYNGDNIYGPTYSATPHYVPNLSPNYNTGWVKLGIAPLKLY